MTKDGPIWLVLLAVGTGAALGAVCRWILNSRLADPYQLPEYSRGHFQTKQCEHIALLF